MEQVGDLTKKSKEELREVLLRQEKILSNKKLIHTLPDKGKRIKDFIEKIHQSLELHEEAERKQRLVSVVKSDIQSKYHQAFTMQQRSAHSTTITESASGEISRERKDSPVVAHEQETEQEPFSAFGVTMEAALHSYQIPETDLVGALERVKLHTGSSADAKKSYDRKAMDNYFVKTHPPAKPHCLSVIEKIEKTTSSTKPKFKTNQLPSRDDILPSGSSFSSQSSEKSSPLSAQARREQDRKHLDDITAAKLPPLHHSPAQLLSLEESAVILREQTKKQQELQAKLVAQKLSEGSKISMGSYCPDGGPMAAYREVHDEGAQLSSEED